MRALIRKQKEQILKLEFSQAARLRKILIEAQKDLRSKLRANPDTWRLPEVQQQINQVLSLTEEKLVNTSSITEEALKLGINSVQPLVGSAANIPQASAFFNVGVSVPIEILTQEQARYVDLVKQVSTDLKDDLLLQTQISSALGEGITPLMNRLTGTGLQGLIGADSRFRPAKNRAETIGRTVVNELVNRASLEGYSQVNNDFPELDLQKEWATTSDRRTSDRCESLQGQIRKLDDTFKAFDGWTGTQPPAHPNCRSRIIPKTQPWDSLLESKAESMEGKRESNITSQSPLSLNPEQSLVESVLNLPGKPVEINQNSWSQTELPEEQTERAIAERLHLGNLKSNREYPISYGGIYKDLVRPT